MTTARVVVGEIFIAIFVLGLLYAALSPILQPITFPQAQTSWITGQGEIERYTLTKGANIPQNVNFVDLNITMRSGGIFINFSDESNLAFDASFTHRTDSAQLAANYGVSDQTLQVNAYGEAGGLNITLGNSCQYNGSLTLKVGGVLMKLDQYSNVSKLAVLVSYAGGAVIDINNEASFQQLDFQVNAGGLQLNIDADRLRRSGAINANFSIGGLLTGVQVDTVQIGVSMDAAVDIGGLNINDVDFGGDVTTTQCYVKTNGYSVAAEKLDITANVGLGGITLQRSLLSIPGFNG
jgi:hypothetical protein